MSTRATTREFVFAKVRRQALPAFILATLPLAVARAQVPAGNGFLLGTPDGSLSIRGGWAVASANSQIFSFTTSNLTLKRRDFSSPILAADLAFRVSPRNDVVVSSDWSKMDKGSEFRDYIDNNDKPIEQSTSFARVSVTASWKHYLTDRGRSIGRLAWIPSHVAPYVGAGGGAMWYRFRQAGDFIDFQTSTLDVFPARLSTEGWTSTWHALAGAEWNLTPRFALVTEARYAYARAPLSGEDFVGFDRVDLSGLTTTAGLAIRF